MENEITNKRVRGAGLKPKREKLETTSIRLSKNHKELFKLMGRDKWLRSLLDGVAEIINCHVKKESDLENVRVGVKYHE